jgi:DNA-binding NarL/FixJ family response regulator
MIRILLADDQRLMCDGLKSMLESNPDFSVASMAYNGKQAIELAERLVPDLVLLDIRMPEMDGVEAVLHLKKMQPPVKVVMLTTFNDEEYILEAMANGADGYLLKDMDTTDLHNAVINTMNGHMVMPLTVAENLKKGLVKIKRKKEAQEALSGLGLSAREMEIAKMVADGFSNSQIATALYLSNGTVRNYVSTLYEKLNTTDKVNAIIKLKDMGL